jgi:hypothetical protein
VFNLCLLLLLVFVVVTVALAAWTAWLQSYIYSEACQGILWRAPAAGAAVAVFLALWVILVARNPGRLGTLTTFAATETQEFDELILTDRDGKPLPNERYRKVGIPPLYRLDGKPKGAELPQHPDGLLARKNGQEYLFLPDRDAKGNFKMSDRTMFGVKQSGVLEYRDKKSGQVMEEGQLGRISTFYFGRFLANILLNGLHLAVWFAVLWLLLQFQWPHALGQAVILWAGTMLFVLPPLFNRAENVNQPAPPAAATTLAPGTS